MRAMRGMKRSVVALTVVPLVLTVACANENSPSSDDAADYPTENIQIIVPFAPGGATDTFARIVADYASANSDVQVQVVNKEGAGGVTGTNEVATSTNDGYTLVATAASSTMYNFSTEQDVPYEPDDLTFLARVSLSPLVLIVKADSPYQTAEDLMTAVAADPTSFRIGTSSLAGPSTFGIGDLLLAQGIDPTDPKLVVLNSGATTVTSVAGGQVEFAAQLAPEVQQLLEGGQIRGLAVSSEESVPSLKGVPTAAEAGIPEFDNASVSGLAGPADLPEPVIEFWEELLAEAVEDEQFLAKLNEIGSVPAFLGTEDYTAWNDEQIEKSAELAVDLGVVE